MELFRQEYWSGLPFPSPGDLPDPGIQPVSLVFPALAGRFFSTSTTWEALPLSNHPQMDHLLKNSLHGYLDYDLNYVNI